MTNSSFKASLWFLERTPEFYFWIVAFISLIVVSSSLKIFAAMSMKSREVKFRYKSWHKWTLLGVSLLIIAMFIGELIFRMIAYYGVQPYHTSFLWKYNLFTTFFMLVMISLWIFKGWLNGQWISWRTDLFSMKVTKWVCKKIKLTKYSEKWSKSSEELNSSKSLVESDNQKIDVLAATSGSIKPLSKVSDEVFSKKLMGDGIAIIPTGDEIISPISGIVESAFPTGHAFGIRSEDGISILVHIGIDTVKLNGEGFEMKVKQGDKVSAGQILSKVDFNTIKKHKLDTDVIVVVLPESSKKISSSRKSGKINAGKTIFEVK